MKDQPKNKFKVNKRQWRKWTLVGQMTFNMLYDHMMKFPDLYKHPDHEFVSDVNFKTTAWNASWMAADLTSRGEKHYIKELMKELGV